MPHSPLLREVEWAEPHEVFQSFAHEPFALLLESSLHDVELESRWSFIALDPYERLLVRDACAMPDPFAFLKSRLAKHTLHHNPALPPFIGGAAGFFGYDLAQALERLPAKTRPFALDDQNLPDMAIGLYDCVIAFDHQMRRAFITSNGAGGHDTVSRADKLERRLITAHPFMASRDLPPATPELVSNFTRDTYENAVKRIIEYIFAGDIFQANLSQRFEGVLGSDESAYALYLRLRAKSPAPFASFFNFGSGQLISSSPERFLSCRDGRVLTQPIKGTRPRGKSPAEDALLAQALLTSEKDRAENVMIVDLLRNDLSKVCEDGSVIVEKLCALEKFATVFHLVSTISGRLRRDADAIDLLTACFPGGSITGAPKLRAMEIIAELEPTTRGPYCGAIGYIGFDGCMDTSIAIRTMIAAGRRVTFQAGGGVIADSEARAEYDETLAKAFAMQQVLRSP